MAVRLFECGWCGHKLRLGSRTCGSCFRPTPFYNRRAFGVTVAGIALAAGLAGVQAASDGAVAPAPGPDGGD